MKTQKKTGKEISAMVEQYYWDVRDGMTRVVTENTSEKRNEISVPKNDQKRTNHQHCRNNPETAGNEEGHNDTEVSIPSGFHRRTYTNTFAILIRATIVMSRTMAPKTLTRGALCMHD